MSNIRRLVIVESPTKAKTIRRFLPGSSYRIEASMGHVRDLPANADEIPENVKKEAWARLGVNIEQDFDPLYIISPDKKKVVSNLKDALKNADELYIATDEDREGESIGWHLIEVLKPKIPVKRMVFHEITEEAILEALKTTRAIDRNLVDAQEARRVLDRLVGYTISPLLWKKIAPKLSAGRVQSVAVRLMVIREKERLAFVPASYWDLKANLAKAKSNFEATMTHLAGIRLATGRDFEDETGRLKKNLTLGKDIVLLAKDRSEELAQALPKQPWKVIDLEEKITSRSPNAPFTTSTLQQEANRKLGWSARDTMHTAQNLYENGYITYMRTDSTLLSQEAIDAARKAIQHRYGDEYLSSKSRQYATKSRNAQEAHEAIRPAGKAMKTKEDLNLKGQEAALYDLIWKRTVATQMAEARLRFVTATIETGTLSDAATFRATGRTTIFPGFFRAYVEGSDDPDAALEDREQPLPELVKGEALTCNHLDAVGHETKPPARFTEASLVKLLEQEGIGRPSTYASIIDTVIRRNYARKASNQLIPTFTAFATNNLMEKQFEPLVDTAFTANMEQKLDDIATGELKARPYLKEFYFGDGGIEPRIKEGLDSVDPREMSTLSFPKWGKYVIRVGKFGPYAEGEINGERKTASLPLDSAPGDIAESYLEGLLNGSTKTDSALGLHPDTRTAMTLRQGPYGPYIQMGEGEKPKRVSLPKGMEPSSVTESIAIGLLSLPRTVGTHPETGQKILANVGRFGPYVQHAKTFASLGKEDVLEVNLERALELLAKKEGKSKALRIVGNHPETGEAIELLDGKYGPYVKHQKTNASLSKTQTPESLTLEEALELLAEREAANPTKTKRSSAKKAPAKKSKAKAKPVSTGPKATAKDLEPFLNELDDTAKNVVMRIEGLKGHSKQDIITVTDELGLSQEEVEKALKRGMFKLRMAFGRSRKSVSEAVAAD
jgi:DNA topoisomerase I